MEFRQLQYFITAAEELHFGHAAERENLTQAAFSQQVQRLERELGVRLFDRTTRRVQLTAAGRLFLDDARVAVARANRAAETARRAGEGEVGQLAVGYPLTGRGKSVSAILRAYRGRYPGMILNTIPSRTADLLDELRHEQIDIAFIHHHIVDDRQLVSRIIVRHSYILAVPAGHRLAKAREVAADQLAAEPFIFFPRQLSPNHYDQLIKDLIERYGVHLRIVEEASALGDLIEGLEAGMGLALIAEPEARAIRSDKISLKKLPTPAPTRPLAVAWRRSDQSPALAAFLAVVNEFQDALASTARSNY